MAKNSEPKFTQDLDLGPGLVVTPGYELPPRPQVAVIASDQPLNAQGQPLDPAPTPVVANVPEAPVQPAPASDAAPA